MIINRRECKGRVVTKKEREQLEWILKEMKKNMKRKLKKKEKEGTIKRKKNPFLQFLLNIKISIRIMFERMHVSVHMDIYLHALTN